MKKVLSIVLAAIMTVSLFAVCVSAAPAGTAITDAAGFAAMKADGTYYLANDITLTAGYTEAFSGTLDGNGKTITTSVTIFELLQNATIKNLTIAGTVDASADDTLKNRGALASIAKGTIVIENVTNNANVTSKSNTAGLVAKVDTDAAEPYTPCKITFKKCVNNGTISSVSHTAGFLACAADNFSKTGLEVIFDECVNNGEIKYTGTGKHAVAGLIGNVSPSFKDTKGTAEDTTDDEVMTKHTIKNCVNTANISAPGASGSAGYTGAAGIAGALGGIITIYNCKNSGNVDGNKGNTAGIIGSVRGAVANATIENCDNLGTLTAYVDAQDATKSNAYVGQIFARGDNKAGVITVKNCYFADKDGKIEGKLTDGFKVTSDGTPAKAPVYKAPEEKKPNPTTGDTSAIIAVAAVAVVALGSSVVVIRKRREEI